MEHDSTVSRALKIIHLVDMKNRNLCLKCGFDLKKKPNRPKVFHHFVGSTDRYETISRTQNEEENYWVCESPVGVIEVTNTLMGL